LDALLHEIQTKMPIFLDSEHIETLSIILDAQG